MTAVLAGCGGSAPSGPPLSVAKVKHAFAEAGIPLRPLGAIRIGRAGAIKTEHLAKGPEASFTWGRSSGEIVSNEILMFWDTESAAELATEMSPVPVPDRMTRVSNVLILWTGAEPPALHAAMRLLS
jgi:hypothetical protein